MYKTVKTSSVFGILLLISFFFGCKKDSEVVNDLNEYCECDPYYNLQGYNLPTNGIYEASINYYAAYNPSNDNEFVYVNRILGIRYLFRFNKLTNEKQLLGTFPNIHSFDWGKNDWILLEIGDRNIWKIKSNGDSLIQLTSGRPYFHSKWNYDASKIMSYFTSNTESYTEILNSNGEIIDTLGNKKIYETCKYGSWNNNNNYVIGNIENSLRVIDPYHKTIFNEKPFSENINEVIWINNTTAIFTNAYGLYQYDLLSNSISKLRCQCPKVIYQRPSSNHDGTKLLLTKFTSDQIGMTVNFNIKVEIVELDLETMKETKIDLI